MLRHRLSHTDPVARQPKNQDAGGRKHKEMTLPTLSTLPWSWPAIFAALVVAALAATARRKDDDSNIPWATGAIPLLGHALAYKRDPATFITEQRKLVGDVFRLNLAGKRMIVIAGGAENVKAVAFASERRFSARAAVRDVGFGELLGERNVDAGTDFHARVLRRWRLDDAEIAELAVALDEGLDAELTGKEVPDLLAAVRGAVLRAVLSRLIGGGILERGGAELVDAIVEFQDGVEEATAAAAVLPRWLALPLILWPAARRRRRLEKRIAAALEGGDGTPGPWATAFGERSLPASIAAEFAVGLLFAAHKNPAIASFQALLFLHERRLPAALHACVNTVDSFQEALVVAKNPSASTLREAQQLCRVALEAIRLTAHTVCLRVPSRRWRESRTINLQRFLPTGRRGPPRDRGLRAAGPSHREEGRDRGSLAHRVLARRGAVGPRRRGI